MCTITCEADWAWRASTDSRMNGSMDHSALPPYTPNLIFYYTYGCCCVHLWSTAGIHCRRLKYCRSKDSGLQARPHAGHVSLSNFEASTLVPGMQHPAWHPDSLTHSYLFSASWLKAWLQSNAAITLIHPSLVTFYLNNVCYWIKQKCLYTNARGWWLWMQIGESKRLCQWNNSIWAWRLGSLW